MALIEEILELTKSLELKNKKIIELDSKIVALTEETKEQQRTINKMEWDHRNAIDRLKEDSKKVNIKLTGDITDEQRAVMVESLTISEKVYESMTKPYMVKEFKTDRRYINWNENVFDKKDLGKIFSYKKSEKFTRYEILYNLELPAPEVTPLGKVSEVFPKEYAKYLESKGK